VKTLTRYVGREVLYATLLIFVALLSLFAFFDLIHELGNVSKDGYPLSRALLFVGLSLPGHVYELMPTAALIGTLFAIAQLVSNSEYTVMRASGASLTQITWAIIRIGIPLAIATFLAGEFLAPPAERLAQRVRAQVQGQASRVFAQQFQSGFWFKQGRQDTEDGAGDHEQTFANIKSLLGDNSLLGVRIYEFDANLRLHALRVAGTNIVFDAFREFLPAQRYAALVVVKLDVMRQQAIERLQVTVVVGVKQLCIQSGNGLLQIDLRFDFLQRGGFFLCLRWYQADAE